MARSEYRPQKLNDEITLSDVIGSYGEKVDAALARLMTIDTKLGEAACEAVLSGGKRVRPALVLMACEAVSGSLEQAMPIAVAYELAHSASLTQDDIIDDSDLRRGAPTTQSKYGVASAMLVSDVLLFKIFEVLGTYGGIAITKRRLATLLAQLGAAARKTAEGEFQEVALASKRHRTESDYVNAAGLKTGSLFAAAAASGAIVGKASKGTVKDLYEYGYHLGISFQIVDDMLDVAGVSSETGKPVFKDLQNDSTNIVLTHAIENADAYKRNIISSMIWKKSYGITDAQSLATIFEETGSLKYARELAIKHASIAGGHLFKLPETDAKARLLQLTHVLSFQETITLDLICHVCRGKQVQEGRWDCQMVSVILDLVGPLIYTATIAITSASAAYVQRQQTSEYNQVKSLLVIVHFLYIGLVSLEFIRYYYSTPAFMSVYTIGNTTFVLVDVILLTIVALAIYYRPEGTGVLRIVAGLTKSGMQRVIFILFCVYVAAD